MPEPRGTRYTVEAQFWPPLPKTARCFPPVAKNRSFQAKPQRPPRKGLTFRNCMQSQNKRSAVASLSGRSHAPVRRSLSGVRHERGSE